METCSARYVFWHWYGYYIHKTSASLIVCTRPEPDWAHAHFFIDSRGMGPQVYQKDYGYLTAIVVWEWHAHHTVMCLHIWSPLCRAVWKSVQPPQVGISLEEVSFWDETWPLILVTRASWWLRPCAPALVDGVHLESEPH